jgi:chemotaxis protein methyltransferase CheR
MEPMHGQGPSASAMNLIGSLLEQRTGQQIAANRAWRIETALKPLLRAHGMNTLDELVNALIATRTGELSDAVVDALLNQETSFFRDAQVLDHVAEAAMALQGQHKDRKLRIWSAGCSTGQEPLSLSILLNERLSGNPGLPVPEITATDISPAALARARSGQYSQFEIQRGLSVRRMISWFDSVDGEWHAKQELVREIRFRQHNLTADPAPPGRYDIVLLRNVLLYFSHSVRKRVFDMVAEAMRPGGLLVLGAGETVIGQTDLFTPSDKFRGFYQAVDTRPEYARSAFG